MISPAKFPTLVEFMQKCLYQLAAPTFEDAISMWLMNGDDLVRRLIYEIDCLLTEDHSETELQEFIDKYSDYAKDGAKDTLKHIKNVLYGGAGRL